MTFIIKSSQVKETRKYVLGQFLHAKTCYKCGEQIPDPPWHESGLCDDCKDNTMKLGAG